MVQYSRHRGLRPLLKGPTMETWKEGVFNQGGWYLAALLEFPLFDIILHKLFKLFKNFYPK